MSFSLLLHKEPQGLPRGCITLRLPCSWSGWLARHTVASLAAKPAEMHNCRDYLMQENCRAYAFGTQMRCSYRPGPDSEDDYMAGGYGFGYMQAHPLGASQCILGDPLFPMNA